MIEVRGLSSIAVAVGVVVIAYDYVCAEGSGLCVSDYCRWRVREQMVDEVKDVPTLCHRFVIAMIMERVKAEDGQGLLSLVQMECAV